MEAMIEAMIEAILSVLITGLIFVVAALIVGKRVFDNTFGREREASFRRILRGWNYSKSEIDQAVEEQGW